MNRGLREGSKMKRHRNGIHKMLALTAIFGILYTGCGGGGSAETGQGTAPPGPSAPVLAWDPPTTFSDNTVLDPFRDLDYYEFFLRTDGNFTDNDVAIAQVLAVTNVLGQGGTSYVPTLTDLFDLNNLVPFTQHGTVYYLSIRSVGMDGLKSHFSAPVIWSQT